jgi:hypothetical protein
MRPQDSYINIPILTIGTREVTENNKKAKAFLEAFFPKMAEAEEEEIMTPLQEITWEPITELEIYRLLKAAKGTTALGEDGIPTLVWKHL